MIDKEIYKAIFATAPDAVIVVDSAGKIVKANDRVQQLFGYDKQELINQPVECLIPERYAGTHHKFRDQYMENAKVREMGIGKELVAKRKDGSEFYVEISLSPMKAGEEHYTSAAIRDVSEKVVMQKQLKSSMEALANKNKELEQFAYVASHDLQSPLNTILSLVALMRREHKGEMNKNENHYLQLISQTAGRMSSLIKDLLDYSRVGREEERMQTTDCNRVVADVLKDLDASIHESQAVIEVGSLPVIQASATELRRLFQNLIANALKFRKPKVTPHVTIGVKSANGDWQFHVTDNGIGIEDRYKEKIFMIFERLHPSREYDGTGIGLAVCQKIVQSHGGKIWVESKVGEGSTFYFTIPG